MLERMQNKADKPQPRSIVSDTNKAKIDPFSESQMEKNQVQIETEVTDKRSSTVNANPDPIIK